MTSSRVLWAFYYGLTRREARQKKQQNDPDFMAARSKFRSSSWKQSKKQLKTRLSSLFNEIHREVDPKIKAKQDAENYIHLKKDVNRSSMIYLGFENGYKVPGIEYNKY